MGMKEQQTVREFLDSVSVGEPLSFEQLALLEPPLAELMKHSLGLLTAALPLVLETSRASKNFLLACAQQPMCTIPGPVGTTKTHLAIALGVEAATRRIRVGFLKAAELVHLRSAQGSSAVGQ
jgi:hypothetical protein